MTPSLWFCTGSPSPPWQRSFEQRIRGSFPCFMRMMRRSTVRRDVVLEMLWTVQHRWTAGLRFAFNCYWHWAQLILRQPGELPVTILSREGVTQGDLLSIVLYRITLVPLAEELRAEDTGLLSQFYADDAAFDGSARRSVQLLKMLMKRGADRGYFPDPAKSLFILEKPGQEEATQR